MPDMIFEWDERKNEANIRKHGIPFSEAMTVFKDENAIVIVDDEHSDYENRFIVLGLSISFRLLVVCTVTDVMKPLSD